MRNILYDAIRQSDKKMSDISTMLNCSMDELIDKIWHYQPFTSEEMNFLTRYIPLNNPVEIFFGYDVH